MIINLSPYEKNRIIKDDFGKTEMGRDLLAQDYLLKQITSSLIYPEHGLGKQFWDKVYQHAFRQYHAMDVPVNTFNKVWIVPQQAVVYESGSTAYILKSRLKVMLQEDYVSLVKHGRMANGCATSKAHSLASRIIKEIVLPEIEKEVNEGENFANLRQVYSGMVLATWYKQELKESLLGRIYADKARLKGVDQDPKINKVIYQRYLQAFKKGVFNYIKEDINKYTHETIPRKYFSGGFTKLAMTHAMKVITPESFAQVSLSERKGWASVGDDEAVRIRLNQALPQTNAMVVGIDEILAQKGDITKYSLDERLGCSEDIRNQYALMQEIGHYNRYTSHPTLYYPGSLSLNLNEVLLKVFSQQPETTMRMPDFLENVEKVLGENIAKALKPQLLAAILKMDVSEIHVRPRLPHLTSIEGSSSINGVSVKLGVLLDNNRQTIENIYLVTEKGKTFIPFFYVSEDEMRQIRSLQVSPNSQKTQPPLMVSAKPVNQETSTPVITQPVNTSVLPAVQVAPSGADAADDTKDRYQKLGNLDGLDFVETKIRAYLREAWMNYLTRFYAGMESGQKLPWAKELGDSMLKNIDRLWIEQKGIIQEQGTNNYWILKQMERDRERPRGFKNSKRRERLAYLLLKQAGVNVAEIRGISRQQADALDIEDSPTGYYLTRVVSHDDRGFQMDRAKAFAGILVARIGIRMWDHGYFNLAYLDGGVPVAIDNDEAFDTKFFSSVNEDESHRRVQLAHFAGRFFHNILGNTGMVRDYYRLLVALDGLKECKASDVDFYNQRFREYLLTNGLDQGYLEAEGFNEENIRDSIRSMKNLRNIRETIAEAGKEISPLGEIERDGEWEAFLEDNLKHLGRDVSYIWEMLTGQPGVFDDMDQDFAMVHEGINNTGGIDFASGQRVLERYRSGHGIQFSVDKAMLVKFKNTPGLVPEVLEIRSAASVPFIKELRQKLQSAGIPSNRISV
ncbi:MAG: hypothetical protein HQL13_07565 [Candidatus Omnitrophica bacterium]|nr:hypothetical protein [Candidatus Omnitrophota bacterium]